MILFDDDIFIFSVKIFDSKRGVFEVKLVNRFERNRNLMYFFMTIIFKLTVITLYDLLIILFYFLVHLSFKSIFDSLTQLLTESVFYIDENNEEEDPTIFELYISLFELIDLLLWEGLIEKVFEAIDVLFMCVICTNLIFSGFSD